MKQFSNTLPLSIKKNCFDNDQLFLGDKNGDYFPNLFRNSSTAEESLIFQSEEESIFFWPEFKIFTFNEIENESAFKSNKEILLTEDIEQIEEEDKKPLTNIINRINKKNEEYDSANDFRFLDREQFSIKSILSCFDTKKEDNYINDFLSANKSKEDSLNPKNSEKETYIEENIQSKKKVNFKVEKNAFKTEKHDCYILINQNNNLIGKKRKMEENEKKKVYVCECGKIFSTEENKRLHYINIHLNKKPYQCNYCNMKFSHRNGKIYHERVYHTFILPYKCQDCQSAFASKSALNYHIKSKH